MYSGKILITGAGGQIGNAVTKVFGVHALPMKHCELDISRYKSIQALLMDEKVACVVNCAGFTDVRKCNDMPKEAWRANVLGAHVLSTYCAALNIPLIHISSDFVFGYQQDRATMPFNEDEATGPVNLYGASKLQGEHEILRIAMGNRDWPYYIIRTAGVFDMPNATEDRNFLSAITQALARLPHPTAAIGTVGDVYTNLTRAEDLAMAIEWFANNCWYIRSGIYHVTNPGETSWHNVSEVLCKALGIPVSSIEKVGTECYELDRQSHGPDPAGVPHRTAKYTCLDSRKYTSSEGSPELPPWSTAVKEWAAAALEETKCE